MPVQIANALKIGCVCICKTSDDIILLLRAWDIGLRRWLNAIYLFRLFSIHCYSVVRSVGLFVIRCGWQQHQRDIQRQRRRSKYIKMCTIEASIFIIFEWLYTMYTVICSPAQLWLILFRLQQYFLMFLVIFSVRRIGEVQSQIRIKIDWYLLIWNIYHFKPFAPANFEKNFFFRWGIRMAFLFFCVFESVIWRIQPKFKRHWFEWSNKSDAKQSALYY